MKIIPFNFEEQSVRVVVDDHGEPWFLANDVCSALGFGNPRQALQTHVDEDDVQKLDVIDSLGRSQQINHINEAGLYALVMGSTKEGAKRFKRWVTHDVLPSIRKTGRYESPLNAPAWQAPRIAGWQEHAISRAICGRAARRFDPNAQKSRYMGLVGYLYGALHRYIGVCNTAQIPVEDYDRAMLYVEAADLGDAIAAMATTEGVQRILLEVRDGVTVASRLLGNHERVVDGEALARQIGLPVPTSNGRRDSDSD